MSIHVSDLLKMTVGVGPISVENCFEFEVAFSLVHCSVLCVLRFSNTSVI